MTITETLKRAEFAVSNIPFIHQITVKARNVRVVLSFSKDVIHYKVGTKYVKRAEAHRLLKKAA